MLRRLLVALAARQTRERKPAISAPVPPPPGGRIDSTPPGITFDQAYQDTIAKLTDNDLADAFEALAPADRLELVEIELAKLKPAELKRIIGPLAYYLNQPWIPLPGPQARALKSKADILFFGGGAGSGKSALLCGTAITNHRHSRLFRRESVQLRGLVEEVQKILGNRDGYNGQDHVWRLPDSNKQIEFAHCQYEQDREKYQGRLADLVGFDEITHFTETQFRYLIGWNRPAYPDQRSRVICTGNPPERADGRWVLSFWAPWLDPSHPNPARDGELRWYTTIEGADFEVDGPGPHGVDSLGQPIMARSRTFIRGLLRDNPYLIDAGYAATLQAHPEPLRSMLLEGRFDLAVSDDPWQVIPSNWIALAQARWTAEPPRGVPMSCIGVDVAMGGTDETVLAPRHGTWFAMPKALKGVNTKDSAGVAGLIFATMRDGCEIAIDVGGGWGADAHGHLKAQQMCSRPINWVNPSGAQTRHGNISFLNQRAEYWWRLREALDPDAGERIALPPDKTLAADLATPLWHRTPSGLIKVEAKEDIRKRLGRSPDRGDAVVMAWAHGWGVERERSNAAPPQAQAIVGYASTKKHGSAGSFGTLQQKAVVGHGGAKRR